MIVVLWRAGLRISEALTLAESDLDRTRNTVVVRRGKGGRRREVGVDRWAWEQLDAWLSFDLRAKYCHPPEGHTLDTGTRVATARPAVAARGGHPAAVKSGRIGCVVRAGPATSGGLDLLCRAVSCCRSGESRV